jgi:hypothetical protein
MTERGSKLVIFASILVGAVPGWLLIMTTPRGDGANIGGGLLVLIGLLVGGGAGGWFAGGRSIQSSSRGPKSTAAVSAAVATLICGPFAGINLASGVIGALLLLPISCGFAIAGVVLGRALGAHASRR